MKGEFVQLSKKSQNVYIINMIAKFTLLFVSLFAALIVKNSYFGWNLIYLSKKNALTKFGPQ